MTTASTIFPNLSRLPMSAPAMPHVSRMTTFSSPAAPTEAKPRSLSPTGLYAWERGRVPAGFWDRADNRIAYMRWLGRKLGFRETRDWYGLTKKQFDENHGAGLLALKYRASPLAALQEFRPEVDWKEWLFKSAPQRFWKSPENRRRYMIWLAGELGICKVEDWYRVSKEDFHRHHGGGFLSNVHHDSPISAVREHQPNYPWKEWLFLSVPKNFWRKPENRFAFMSWLGETLNLKNEAAWKSVSKQDFYINGGGGLLANYYGDSPANAIAEFLNYTAAPTTETSTPTAA